VNSGALACVNVLAFRRRRSGEDGTEHFSIFYSLLFLFLFFIFIIPFIIISFPFYYYFTLFIIISVHFSLFPYL
jgi:hypothetical protein